MSQEISKININGTAYNVKDATARADIDSLELEVDKKVTDEADGTVMNVLNFVQGLSVNGAVITCEGDTVTFS
jgi:hypothetical protein